MIGLYKPEPLETLDQLAERIVKDFEAYQQRTNAPKPSKKLSVLDNAKLRVLAEPLKLLRKFCREFLMS